MKKEPITKLTLKTSGQDDTYVSTTADSKHLDGKLLPESLFAPANRTGLQDYYDKKGLAPETVLEARKIVLEDVVKRTVDHPKESKQNEQSEGVMILRSHFVSDILKNLEKVQECAQQPIAAMYVSNIIKSSRKFFTKNSSDPFIEIVMALHDALIYDSSWANYSSIQYKKTYQILKRFALDNRLNSKKVEKAIIALSDAGLEVLPFDLGVELDF